MRTYLTTQRLTRALTLAFVLATLVGCQVLPKPKIPVPINLPTTQVLQVRQTASSAEATRFEITLRLSNPNDFPLPLTNANYTLKLAGQPYTGATLPNTTLPASGAIDLKLPAVILAENLGPNYTLQGSIQLLPPGQVKQLGYEMGIPQPTTHFKATGAVINN